MEQTQLSDFELISQWREGCRRAGDELIHRHSAAVFRFYRSKVACEPEDLVQQTFLACFEGRSQFREESSFRTYLLAIARYQLYARYGQRRRDSANVELSSIHDLGTWPTGILASRERLQLLVAALQQLPREAQAVLERAYVEGLSGPEIACALDIPLNTVYSRLRRAKRNLRALLERDCPEYESEPHPMAAAF